MTGEEMIYNLLWFLIGFLIIFVLTYMVYHGKIKKRKKKEISEITYLVKKFNLDEKKLPIKKMVLWISIQNAFIISFVWTFINILPINFIWQLIIAFVLVFSLIYAIYEIYGRHLVNKGYQKKEGRK